MADLTTMLSKFLASLYAGIIDIGAAGDALLARISANVVGQQNGSTAQEFRVYGNATKYSTLMHDGTFGYVGTGTGSGSIIFMQSGNSRWQLDANGHFLAVADNTLDIGAAAATRPRNIHLGGSIVMRVKAGTPVDGDFVNPVDGMMAVDSTGVKLWVRVGGLWKGVVIA